MRTISLSNIEARRFLLAHQGIGITEPLAGKQEVVKFIRRVGCIQFDPLNIVGRNPEIVLQARFSDFKPSMLQELLYLDRVLLDGWDKVMSIYLTEDWPYFGRFREASKRRYSSIDAIVQSLPEVRKTMEQQGPLASGGLQLNQTIDWAWAPSRLSRAALESMWYWGEIVIHHRKNNQKVYDFASRCLTGHLLQMEEPNPTQDAYIDWRLLRRIGGIGLLWEKAGDAWIGISGLKAAERKQSFNRLWKQGLLTRLEIEGMSDFFYARTEDVDRLLVGNLKKNTIQRAAIIAPLDNLLWDRRMIKSLFGFDYTWEVYKPQHKRDYGYYVLPIIYGDKFVARFEPGRNKQDGSLVIKNWWWEPDVQPLSEMLQELRQCFTRFIRFLGAPSIQIDRTVASREGIEPLLLTGSGSAEARSNGESS